MSANSSYFDVSILKGQQIIWTIDLSKKQKEIKRPIPIPEPEPQNLLDLAKIYINSLSISLDETISSIPQRYPGSSIRKIAKKIIKYKRIRLSELASQFKSTKSFLKYWLKKGENSKGDTLDYEELFKWWIQDYSRFLSRDELNDVIIGFNKSLSKNLINSGAEIPSKAEPHLIESIMLDNRFPAQKINPEKDTKAKTTTLNRIQIDVSANNININDSILWDEQDSSEENLLLFASTFIKEILEEQKIKTSEEVVKKLEEDVVKQIREQVNISTQLKSQVEMLIEFNPNSSNYKQKEDVIQISLNIRNEGAHVLDNFDWEIDPVHNQPESFAEKYIKENNLPQSFLPLITNQVTQQIDDHLQKRLNTFCQLYEPKIGGPKDIENPDEVKRINNKIRSKVVLSVNEKLQNFPVIPPFSNNLFLKNAELLSLVNKYSDLLPPIHRNILNQQKTLMGSQPNSSNPKTPTSGNQPISKNPLLKKTQANVLKTLPTQFPFQTPPFLANPQLFPQVNPVLSPKPFSAPMKSPVLKPSTMDFANKNIQGPSLPLVKTSSRKNTDTMMQEEIFGAESSRSQEFLPYDYQSENRNRNSEDSLGEQLYSNGFLKE